MAADPAQIEDHVARMHELMARVLVADFPTVAAIQGHAFAGGAMLALARHPGDARGPRLLLSA